MYAGTEWILAMDWSDFGLVIFGASMVGIILGLLARWTFG